ncbi:uncharacterized protein SEPMUDRAFT_121268 [Sphaerulina musiva SO2202]|uniref:Uncharacterized protein n=1 Tax=Sphaerulina musiva (strain SO2202) TaxID=692275 RepID=M3BQV2_SPHMS|nr:uncharacterized protein SEPMUDRAFT_121268 [Sphaerulina musiva SO2202]EMF08488.1 hypothetical protein SEPMUDRAFT_121268 [Sphaerulina musiva SO2202]
MASRKAQFPPVKNAFRGWQQLASGIIHRSSCISNHVVDMGIPEYDPITAPFKQSPIRHWLGCQQPEV